LDALLDDRAGAASGQLAIFCANATERFSLAHNPLI
jgi:hypothetical protein